jgi:hypothetical protein
MSQKNPFTGPIEWHDPVLKGPPFRMYENSSLEDTYNDGGMVRMRGHLTHALLCGPEECTPPYNHKEG